MVTEARVLGEQVLREVIKELVQDLAVELVPQEAERLESAKPHEGDGDQDRELVPRESK